MVRRVHDSAGEDAENHTDVGRPDNSGTATAPAPSSRRKENPAVQRVDRCMRRHQCGQVAGVDGEQYVRQHSVKWPARYVD